MRRGPETQLEDTLATHGAGRAEALDLGPGDVVAGRYEILSTLGEGGMGAVYAAHDLELDESVAFKVLRGELAGSEDAERRFRSEVRLARKITHKNVARIFEFGTSGTLFYLTMELVEGRTLADELRSAQRLTPERAAKILVDVAAGLEAVHEAGVIHRDIKPGNVLMASTGRVVLTDFGIALLSKAREDAEGLVGTPDYMSPEQVQGLELTPVSDVYSLGVMAFELLTGKRPFAGKSAVDIALARLERPAPSVASVLPDLPSALTSVVDAALSADPRDRPSTAQEFASRLERSVARASTQPISIAISSRPAMAKDVHALAVLRFDSGEVARELADGLREEVVDGLSTVRGLRVLSPRSVDRVIGPNKSPEDMGKELGATYLLEGTLRGDAARSRLSARLLSVDGSVVGALRREITPESLLISADEVVRSVSESLELHHDKSRASDQGTDPQAIEHYLRGRAELLQFAAGAAESFRQALARAPDHPLFLAALASAEVRAAVRAPHPDPLAMSSARSSAERAILRGPDLVEPQLALAQVLLHEGQLESAVRALRRALSLGPSSSEAHALMGELLVEAGRLTEGAHRLSAALAIDPGSILAAVALARMHGLSGEWERGYEILRRAGLMTTGAGPLWAMSARFAVFRGDRQAAEEIRQALPGKTPSLVTVVVRLYLAAFLDGVVLDTARDVESEPTTSARRTALTHQVLAEVYTLAGRQDDALRALEKSSQHGLIDLIWLDRCPLFQGLRGSRRFLRIRDTVSANADKVIDALWS